MGIVNNEKYKGDILLGKTFTVDPISKRRLDNLGEEDRLSLNREKNENKSILNGRKKNQILCGNPRYEKI